MQIASLVAADLLTADDKDYRQYFVPFASTGITSLEKRLASASEDRYWGIWFKDNILAGFFMLRGFDEGYMRPSFGVYIAGAYSGKGLAGFALDYSMSWCRINNIEAMMLKVHPDNRYARRSYEKAGFTVVGTCPLTGHTVMEKRWSEGK